MSTRKIRVLIVEDSPVIRQFLEHIIARDPRLEIAGAVSSGEEALRVLPETAPDVISMDIQLPGMNGFEATQRIMRERPTPIVVVSATNEQSGSGVTMNALSAGALAVLEKPPGASAPDYEILAERLCTQLSIMSQVKVVRHHRPARVPIGRPRREARTGLPHSVLGIVSSTGGPAAMVQLLSGFGKDFPLPILLVQHIAANLLPAFAAWLEGATGFPVETVRGRRALAPGCVFVAAQDHHLRAEAGLATVDRGEPVCAQRPSGNVLFDSLASAYGERALGLLLTGMGEDGAEGLLRLHGSGGYTIAEDQSSAVVYGMPAAAVRLGAVSESLPLSAIAPRILELTQERSEAPR
jgi:two-component system chemotaxis response regulator CheB